MQAVLRQDVLPGHSGGKDEYAVLQNPLCACIL